MFPKTNPTNTESWVKLQEHFEHIKGSKMSSLFEADPSRASEMSVEFNDIFVDYSKNRITKETLDLLIQLAEECIPP